MVVFAINFKAYAFGNNALEIAKIIDELAKQYQQEEVIIAVPLTEIKTIVKEVSYIKVYAQTADAVEPGAHTGKMPIEGLVQAGARGVVVNHAENQIKLNEIDFIINKAQEFVLETLVCAATPLQAKALASFNPDYIAYEPPELIGTGKSVSELYPQSIKDASKKVKVISPTTKFLVGAGITSYRDVDESLYLGAQGVFIASAIMKSKNIKQKVEEFFSFHY
ncbi:MAG: triose-phosphate isomerase [Candidatus Nanohaloarchaeota archaeon]|nr:triose-phosphate isomerase [Candidatus Nanohaloarchaeota archaeon]